MRQRAAKIVLTLCFFGVLGATPAVALNERTHEIINEQAMRQPRPGQLSIDRVLKEQLGFPRGIEETIDERAVLKMGGQRLVKIQMAARRRCARGLAPPHRP